MFSSCLQFSMDYVKYFCWTFERNYCLDISMVIWLVAYFLYLFHVHQIVFQKARSFFLRSGSAYSCHFVCSILPPAYVVRREGNSFTLFVCPHLRGGYPYPIMLCNISQNAMRQRGGTWPGTPPRGGYPGRTTEGVLTTRRAVCLLRSRRRTFLFFFVLLFYCFMWIAR